METKKLYYGDCHLQCFSAKVLDCRKTEKGFQVILEETAFYPEGGGQACDLGTLGEARVLDVREDGEAVVHLCDRPLTVGTVVQGRIDWARRFDLMQQHSGEHILSGLIHKTYGYHNVGFHVGQDTMEIDFDGPIPPEELTRLEAQANAAIWENLPIRCYEPSREELPQVAYRTKKPLPWPVRIVEVPGYDTCACCGVHVAATGEIGLIKILSCTKFHQGVRLELVCGQRAYRCLCQVYDQNRLVSQTFSAKILETGAAAQRISQQLAAEKFRSAGLEKQVFSAIAAGYAGKGSVVHFENTLSAGAVRELADRIADTCGGTAAVFSGSNEAGYCLCLASRTGDVKPLGTSLTAALHGRGGGKGGFFQGSVQTTRPEIEAFFRKFVSCVNYNW